MTVMQRRMPMAVGINTAAKVCRMLPVSLRMVRMVVEQGQWNRENREHFPFFARFLVRN